MALFDSIRLGSSAAGDYEIERSLRFNDDDSTYLQRNVSSSSNRKTFTISVWVKRSNITDGLIFGQTDGSGNDMFHLVFDSNHKLYGLDYDYPTNNFQFITTQVFRDPSAWYHIVLAVDTTQATNTNRWKLYVNGSQVTAFDSATYPSQNLDTWVNHTTYPVYIGIAGWTGYKYDGYIAEYNFIDGLALTPSSFGETDVLTGQWNPKKYTGSYGTNGFYLNFSDNSNNNATTLGKDSSGNGHNFTPNNFATSDSVKDSPTLNFATLNNIDTSGGTFAEGNLSYDTSGWNQAGSTFMFNTGKWYCEVCVHAYNSGNDAFSVGILEAGRRRQATYWSDGSWSLTTDGYLYGINLNGTTEKKISGGSEASISGQPDISEGSIIGLLIDLDSGTTSIKYNVNGGTFFELFTGMQATDYVIGVNSYQAELRFNFGQDSSFAGSKTAQGNTDSAGNGDFYYTPTSGFKALCTANLPDPSIKLPAQHFNTLLYTGNGGTQSITGLEFQPDWVWLKKRNGTTNHLVFDSVRGTNKSLNSNGGGSEDTSSTNKLTSFNSDGFTLGSNASGNNNSDTYVAWNWKGGGSASSNGDGSLTASVSANTTAGFSIGTYTGQSSGSATVGHGLGVAPDVVITKSRTSSSNWYIYHKSIGQDGWIILDSNGAATTGNSAVWNPAPTSSVFTYGSGLVNQGDVVFYAFSEVAGYNKFGSYTGNGSSDGTFVFTGFRPAYVLVKDISSSYSWDLHDNKRDPDNVTEESLAPNLSNAEDTYDAKDFLANGFKLRSSSNSLNKSGDTYIYLAFAESPFKYSRAR